MEHGSAEFDAYRPSWVRDEEQGAVVYLSVGDLYPNGYRNVDSDRPYLGVYTRELRTLGLKGPAREEFSKSLRSRWGNLLDEWKNEPEDRQYPALEYVVVPPEERTLLMMDADKLYAFAVSTFSRLLRLADGIDECLKTIKP